MPVIIVITMIATIAATKTTMNRRPLTRGSPGLSDAGSFSTL